MIIPSATYPSQTAVDANYPQGKARNVSSSGDNTGTPFEAQLVNDLWGFCQALVLAADISPSGAPDNANTSDLLAAVRTVAQQRAVGIYAVTNVAKSSGQTFGLTQVSQYGGFSLVSNQIQVPVAGNYRVTFLATATGDATANPTFVGATLNAGGVSVETGNNRYSVTTSLAVRMIADYVFTIATPSLNPISLVSSSGGNVEMFTPNQIVVERVG